ncbi:MAG: NAD(P)H-nitrite reductase, large subunit [Candidatus Methanocomedens sp.]|jgi:NAD(P)H-nitrite reductase large subunit|nr:MAG: NAD(P)H-nitrite reductase, large subunit [ANME-2 cluster archaeon]
MKMADEKKTDLPEKGAVLQRDRETYAIAPDTPAGIVPPETLRKFADVAEKYNAAAIKITSAQRMVIVGLKEEDIDNAWKDLGMSPGAAIGLCVRSVKICPGTAFCKRAVSDSLSLGMALHEAYHGMSLPAKFKMGASGCPNCCAESWVKDIGFIGFKDGFKVVVGGEAGRKPRIGTELTYAASIDDAMKVTQDIIDYYKANGKPKERLGELIERIGFTEFSNGVLK